MSFYPPPTEDLPTFNSSLFNSTNMASNYLQYPTAQGPETIGTLTTTNFTLNNSKFALGTGSSATLASQIAIGASSNTVYIPTPLRSISVIDTNSVNIPYLTRRDIGVYFVYNNAPFEIPYSIPNLGNRFTQAYTSGNTNYTAVPNTGSAIGSWAGQNITDLNEQIIVYPDYGIRGFDLTSYSSELINFQNNTKNPVTVKTGANFDIASVKIYYKGVEQVMAV